MPERILVIDDESHVRESTVRLLQRKGYEVEGAGSGIEALEQIGKESFDLLLIDIKMPGMSGLEFLRQAKERNPDTIALIITGDGTVENAIEALELGALGFVRKPVPIDELAKAIDETLAKGRLTRENARLKALLPLFELSKVFLSEVDENKLFDLILDTVVSETKADIAQISLWDGAGNLVVKATRGLSPMEGAGKIVVDEASVQAASKLKLVVVPQREISDTKTTQPVAPGNSGRDIYIPLIVRGEAIGVLKASKQEGQKSFKQSDIEFLHTLCGQGAIAIANARLFESVHRKQAEVEELLKRVINTTESERLRLSLELHDGPVQSIVASQYGVEACRMLINKNELKEVEPKLQDIQQMLAQSIHDLRRIVRDLHPPALSKSGFVSAVQEYLSNLERDNGINCHLDVKGDIAHLDTSTERGVYYVVREALTNVRKHAEAPDVHVIIEFQDDRLVVNVVDNGKGFNPLAKSSDSDMSHLGLRSMTERAKMLNGSIIINSKPGEGTKIKLIVPINGAGAKRTASLVESKHSTRR